MCRGPKVVHVQKTWSTKMENKVMNGEVQSALHMNGGIGETSYANNSTLQKTAASKAWPILHDVLKNLYYRNINSFPETYQIADLGCSLGPNSFLVISKIIDTIQSLALQNHCQVPEFQIYLNDLPENDFNTIFKLLPTFYKKVEKEKGPNCFIAGVPGSFYGRLFPRNSLHLVHSSYSLHWLSQVPENLENKGNIYISRTSLPSVFEAYLKQFQKDFSTFLRVRSKEIIPGGHVVLTIIGRSTTDPTSKDCCCYWELLAKSLLELVSEGIIQAEDVDSFNLPYYSPYKDEVKSIVQGEGSLNLERLEVLDYDSDIKDNEEKEFAFDNHRSAKNVANRMRATTEPLLASHFGEFIIDDLFEKFAKLVANHLRDKSNLQNIVISLSKN